MYAPGHHTAPTHCQPAVLSTRLIKQCRLWLVCYVCCQIMATYTQWPEVAAW
jgi:hypothetical protein